MDKGPRDHFSGSHYEAPHITGPVGFLNPTKRSFPIPAPPRHPGGSAIDGQAPKTPVVPEPRASEGIYHVWRSRDNRKGRHSAIVTPEAMSKAAVTGPWITNTWAQTWRGVKKMAVRYPVWDVSYDVAIVFTLGSVIWVINAFFVWLPLAAPTSEFPGESSMGGGITAFIGATVFEVGSVLLMLEAVNENRTDCFGWALEEAAESSGLHLHPSRDHCQHHHKARTVFLARGQTAVGGESLSRDRLTGELSEGDQAVEQGDAGKDPFPGSRRWSWWPTWYELSTHYFRDIGFLACLSQMLGATVFWTAGFTGLPPILDSLSTPTENGVFWVPQVVGGTGFIVSSLLFMLEVQEKWYIPAPKVLGWHIGFWNLVGALGFTLCGVFGFVIEREGMEVASTLSTFVGSWAFLIGSVVQWFESLDKYPVTVEKSPALDATDGNGL